MPRKANSDDETLRQLNAMVSGIPTGKALQKLLRKGQKKPAESATKDHWRKDERLRQKLVESGQSVTANAKRDKNLILWAEEAGRAVRIDRGTKYGNPFIMNQDGDRDHVCDCYEKQYLPNKPSITKDAELLAGKVLICHCYPARCHGDALVSLTTEQVRPAPAPQLKLWDDA